MLAENRTHGRPRSLRLVSRRAGTGESPDRRTSLALSGTPHVRRFLTAAAAKGLGPEVAIRLIAEHTAALEDLSSIGLDRRAVKHILHRAAGRARPTKALGETEAGYARSLSLQTPLETPDLRGPITVVLPERLLTRIGWRISPLALEPASISEAVAWELAATFSGRTLIEWALLHAAAGAEAQRASAVL